MRKFAAILLSVLVALCAVAAAEEIDYTGMWVLTEITMAGVSVDPSTAGIESALEINQDGTCTLAMTSSESATTESGTWVATEGGISITDEAGDTQEMTYADGVLSMTEAGMTMNYVQQQYAQVLTGLTLEDFRGKWNLLYLETADGYYMAADMGITMTLDLQGESAHIDMTTEDGAESMDAVCELEENDSVGSVLYVSILDAATGEPDGSGMTMLLFDDGMLAWYEYDDETGTEYFYNFERAE